MILIKLALLHKNCIVPHKLKFYLISRCISQFFPSEAGNARDSILSSISSSDSLCGFSLSVLWGQVNFFMVAGQEKIVPQGQLK